MSELRLFYYDGTRLKMSRNIDMLQRIPMESILWIDLNDVSLNDEDRLEKFLKIYIQEEEEIEEIELSSRYIETEDSIVANSNFLVDDTFEQEPISFILKNNILVSVRNVDLKSFNEATRKIFANTKDYRTGFHVFCGLIETRVDMDADTIEHLTAEVSELSKTLSLNTDLDEEILISIKNLQEKAMLLRENIQDKRRVMSSIYKSSLFPPTLRERLGIILRDIDSLNEHIRFAFERLEYLQDTFLGLLNVEQNQIMRVLTVASIIFMPPTLVASIYGMNFDWMPFLHSSFGFFLSILFMCLLMGAFLLYFHRKKWL